MPLIDGADPAQVRAAARCLAGSGLLAFPTETVYGLGARADDDAAVALIFEAKGRPADHPLIVHVADVTAAFGFASHIPKGAQDLMAAAWPGPLTLILERKPGVAEASAGGQGSIGLRCPAHPVAQALLREAAALGVPGVSGPSANRFGRISPTRAAHVQQEFGQQLLVLDGGPCSVGIESTIVDYSRGHPVLLRPGVLTRSELEHWAAEPLLERDGQAPRAPGSLAAHYAPKARLRVASAAALCERLALRQGQDESPPVALYSLAGYTLPGVLCRTMPTDARAAARELFAVLRDFDATGVSEIWVEQPPDLPEWEGVRDRLARASA